MKEIFNFLNFRKKKEKNQELQEVLNFPIEIFCSQKFEIRTFRLLNTLDYGTLNPKIQLSNKILIQGY